ncbi:MAG: hypothetical protein ABI238_03940, partial [Terrimesophilobacter sp.]
MTNPAAELDEITGSIARLLAFDAVPGLADDALLQTTSALERLGCRLGAIQVAVAAELDHRSRHDLGTDGLAASKGCRNSTELLERITRASGETIAKRLKIGRNTRIRYTLVGERLAPPFAHVAEALEAGALGLDSAYAVIRGLTSVASVVDTDSIRTAEYELVA